MAFNAIIENIVKMLNGTIVKDDCPSDGYARINFDNNVCISFRRGYGSKSNKVSAYAGIHGIDWSVLNMVDRPKMPEITFAIDKASHKIVSDVANRLISPSHELIAKVKSDIKKYNEKINTLESTANELQSAYDDIRFSVINNRLQFNYYDAAKGFFSGNADEKVYSFDRINGLNREQAEMIFQIIKGKK